MDVMHLKKCHVCRKGSVQVHDVWAMGRLIYFSLECTRCGCKSIYDPVSDEHKTVWTGVDPYAVQASVGLGAKALFIAACSVLLLLCVLLATIP